MEKETELSGWACTSLLNVCFHVVLCGERVTC